MLIANVEMAKAWDGDEGDDWATHADRYERTTQRHWRRFVDSGLIGEVDAVLDVGCGTGKSTRDAARAAPSGSALGVDLSARMLERARERSRAEGLTNIRFEQADAQVHPFEKEAFDVAISSFGAMFFNDPVAAFTNVARGVRPGGRLALLAWRDLESNEWLTVLRRALAVGRVLPAPPPGTPGPFGLADPTQVEQILEAAGFGDVAFEMVDEPTEWGTDAEDAFAFVRTLGIVRGLTQDLDGPGKARALDDLHTALAAHETDEGVLLGSSAWLITARRR